MNAAVGMAIESVRPGRPLSIKSTRELRAVLVNNSNLERGNQQPAPQRPRRHQLSIGLSLAESLILVLFLLSVVLGARLAQIQKQASDTRRAYDALQASVPALKSLLERFQRSDQLQTEAFDEVVVKVGRAMEAERAAADVARENAQLRAQLASHKSRRSGPQDRRRVPSVRRPAPQTVSDAPPTATLSVSELLTKVDPGRTSAAESEGGARPEAGLPEGESAHLPPQNNNVSLLVGSGFAPKATSSPTIANPRTATDPRRMKRSLECNSGARLRWHLGEADRPVSFWCPRIPS